MHEINGYTVGGVGMSYGPCADATCRNTGCHTAREIAAVLCVLCEQPAGQGVHLIFVRTTPASLAVAHHSCFVKSKV